MLYYEIPWFYQDFKSRNLRFSNLYSAHAERILDTGPVTKDHVKSSQMRNKAPLKL